MTGREKLIEALRAMEECGTLQGAAYTLGIPRTTLQSRLKRAEEIGLSINQPDQIDINNLPDYGGVRQRLFSYNKQYINGIDASRHITQRTGNAPFGVFFIGDPHMDSPGFDDRKFASDMDIIRAAQEDFPVYVVNMGDVLDHWPIGGRLGKKHHDSHITRAEALALVKGFLQEEGLNFIVHLIGNHDAWPGIDFQTLMQEWSDSPVVDWGCYIHFENKSGWEFNVFASHDMAGHSMHNPLHALMRRAREEGLADLYVAAHRHSGGRGKDENGYRGKTYNYMRVAGYKKCDEYAWRKGYAETNDGATGLAVIDPRATTPDSTCMTFYDLERGVEWLKFLTGCD